MRIRLGSEHLGRFVDLLGRPMQTNVETAQFQIGFGSQQPH